MFDDLLGGIFIIMTSDDLLGGIFINMTFKSVITVVTIIIIDFS